MKKSALIALSLVSLPAFAVDFDLRPLDQGGNADFTMLKWQKISQKPDAYLGKSILVTELNNCFADDIKGLTKDKKIESFDGVSCYGSGGRFAVTGDLKQRDTLRNRKVMSLKGTIVGLNEHHSIIIKPTEIDAK